MSLTLRDYFSTQAERFSQDDARKIGPELDRLMADGKRELGDVVEAARPDDAPLHPYFTWDDAVAAERFRQLEAGRMVRAIQVRVTQGDRTNDVPAFTPISIRVTPASTPVDAPESGPVDTLVSTGRRLSPRPPSSGPLVAAQPWGASVGRPHPPTRAEVLLGAEPVSPMGETASVSRILDTDAQGAAPERRYPARPPGTPPRQFVPEPGHTVWRDGQDPSLPVLPVSLAENLDKLDDDAVIGRALASLLGFEAAFGGQRRREAFEYVFAPVFEAIDRARKRAGLGDATD